MISTARRSLNTGRSICSTASPTSALGRPRCCCNDVGLRWWSAARSRTPPLRVSSFRCRSVSGSATGLTRAPHLGLELVSEERHHVEHGHRACLLVVDSSPAVNAWMLLSSLPQRWSNPRSLRSSSGRVRCYIAKSQRFQCSGGWEHRCPAPFLLVLCLCSQREETKKW
uniref:Uncharacterized protein n=1 Tax=Oryza nivara TaxID=4536 RepID=A0A0E0FNF5_ORYNI